MSNHLRSRPGPAKSVAGAFSCTLTWVVLALAGNVGTSPAPAAEPSIRFSRDIRPIFSDTCFACHGPDQKARKASLRLDTKDGLYESTPKRGPAFVPGSLEKSAAWQRITATDPDDIMPPPDSHKTLTAEQKDRLRRWILEGALWQGHWAYIKPERPAVPKVRLAGFTVRNPIDAFVLERLQQKGLRPAPEADRRALARRLTLDVSGLPPGPELVEAFVQDRAPDAYEQLLKRLMASPQWGEHRARYWLDAARYADTHGLHFDNYREIWPYRDWVIRAFNRNLPFDRFTIEQLAGDLLEDAGDDEKVATGFQRCNMTTNEGGTIEDENLANYANDRVTTTGWVWLGATINCCACHDHKFDPFTTRDFYSLSAFYRNTKQSGFDKNRRESDLYLVVPQTDGDRTRWHALPREIEAARQALAAQETEATNVFSQWLAQLKPQVETPAVLLPQELVRIPLVAGHDTNLAVFLRGQRTTRRMPRPLLSESNAPFGTAPVLTKGGGVTLGDLANFEGSEPFSAAAWVRLPPDFKGEGSILARMAGEEAYHRGWDFYVRDESFGMHFAHRWSTMGMAVRADDKTVKRGQWQHLAFTYDGSGRTAGVKLFVNGVEVGANRDQNGLEGSTTNSYSLRLGRREQGNELDGVALQDVRLYPRRLAGSEVRALSAGPRLAPLLAQTQADSTNAAVPAAVAALRDYFFVTQHPGWQKAAAQLAALEREQQAIRGRSPVTLVQEEKTNSEPTAQILFRGQYDKPKEKVTAATPAALHPMPPGAPRNRLGLAQWLMSRENPLTARVIVNRFWQEVFGIGLVKTTEDFGTTGDQPSHPELLDWLAVEFQESGWDIKHLFTLMLTSSTYRQAALTTPEKLEKDPQNRLLSRGPRFRMDAEMVRDYALAASGLLSEKLGGPSVRPYQPPGVWEAVAMIESNTRYYRPDEGNNLYRRSLYTFWKRAAPPAAMDLFNAPSRETCTVRRERTNTPLQALATLNDPEFVEAARHLAETALAPNPRRPEEAIDSIAERLLARRLTAEERGLVRRTLGDMQRYYDQHLEAAQQLVRHGASKPSSQLPLGSLAALTMVANQLMNLDEVLNK